LRIRVHGLWTQPWLVIERYGQPIPEDHLPNAHAQIRLHVKNTGDTEKKRRQPAHQKSR